MIKFLVVDAHPVLREGTAALLRQGFAPAAVIGVAEADEARRAVARHGDLAAILLDLDLPGAVGPQLLRDLVRHAPRTPIIVQSASEAKEDVRGALTLGASGYLPKTTRDATFKAAVHLVLEGGIYVPPSVLRDPEAAAAPLRGGFGRLSGRQSEILARLAHGETNAAIAGALGLAEKTVKVHVTAIFRTLGVADRRQAARLALEAGLGDAKPVLLAAPSSRGPSSREG